MICLYFILCLHTRFKYTSFGAVCDVGCPRRHSRRHPRRHAGRRQPTTIPTPFDTVLDPLGGSRDQVGWVFRGRFSGSCTKYWWHFILIRCWQFSQGSDSNIFESLSIIGIFWERITSSVTTFGLSRVSKSLDISSDFSSSFSRVWLCWLYSIYITFLHRFSVSFPSFSILF